ncbi:hypothetical protein COU61_03330 [Candidatus Pacearchaeota archaeon CG10_big_fil_rev_8_21_14_0_10_35_13]|nr:MAG: hypothetical protein COU61_03330 [Candidatus Pacearchaeota archaeon CG10_big_fil_rev_8_21_14_0_10_35_13]
MNNKGKIALITGVALVVLVIALLVSMVAAGKNSSHKGLYECNDRIDNDGDGYTDMKDAGCSGKKDKDETNCGDGTCEGGETSQTCSADCGVQDSCSDTDNGQVSNVQGTTSGFLNNNAYSNTDLCADTGNVKEYYCSGNYEQNTTVSCGTDSYGSNYCQNGNIYKDYTDKFCSTGSCGATTTAQIVENCTYGCSNGTCLTQPANSCNDSDGGTNYWNNGTVTGYYDGQSYSNTDYCVNPNNSTGMVEYSCSGTVMQQAYLDCALLNATLSCSNGACI